MSLTKEEWKAKRIRPVTLPSGAEILFQLPNVSAMVRAGRIPNPLLPLAIKLDASTVQTSEIQEAEQFTEWTNFCRLLILDAVVEPVLDQADVDLLPTEDYDQLYNWVLRMSPLPASPKPEAKNGEVESVGELASFHPERSSS